MDSYLNANFSLHELLQKQIPKELETLEASSTNLERVAAYCEANYGKVIHIFFLLLIFPLFYIYLFSGY